MIKPASPFWKAAKIYLLLKKLLLYPEGGLGSDGWE